MIGNIGEKEQWKIIEYFRKRAMETENNGKLEQWNNEIIREQWNTGTEEQWNS